MVHGLLGTLMLIDLIVVNHEVQIIPDLFCSASVGLAFSIFSIVYYLANGTNRQLNHAIYPYVDWKMPGRTFLVCVASDLLVMIVHFIVYCLSKMRHFIYKKFCMTKENEIDPSKEIERMCNCQC